MAGSATVFERVLAAAGDGKLAGPTLAAYRPDLDETRGVDDGGGFYLAACRARRRGLTMRS
jgi:hypothetical protein